MREETNRRTLRSAPGAVPSLKIMDEAERLKAKPEWSSASRLIVSLVNDDRLDILLTVLKKGARLAEQLQESSRPCWLGSWTEAPIAVHVLSGAVRFGTGDECAKLSSGSIAALDREIVHELEALDESVVLLIAAIE
jgi:hypothetical protein